MDLLTRAAEFFDILHKQKLSWKVNDRPAYSDLAYILLGFALENITGKSFDEMIRDSITSRLGLSATGIETPDLSKAVIPPGIAGVFMGFDIANFNSSVLTS
jgi:CubicO group peptidase (beta-lactamase class C family)